MKQIPLPEERPAGGHAVKERVRTELRQYAITSAYLFVWLAALLLYKTALLRQDYAATLPLGIAAGKALILGKFVLIGEAAGVGSRLGARTLLERIAWKALSLLLLLVLLSVLEEFVVGWMHGRSPAGTLADYESRSILELGATCLLMLLVLVPFVAAKQVSLALGPGVLRHMLFEADERPAAPETEPAA